MIEVTELSKFKDSVAHCQAVTAENIRKRINLSGISQITNCFTDLLDKAESDPTKDMDEKPTKSCETDFTETEEYSANTEDSSEYCESISNSTNIEDNFEPIVRKNISANTSENDNCSFAKLSRAEIVQKLVDSVFLSFSLISVNTTFFGDLAEGMSPNGYHVQSVGRHTFYVKNEKSLSLASIISFLEKVKPILNSEKQIIISMVYRRNVEGSVLRSLLLTENEIQEIMKIYPELQFGYVGHLGSIDEIKLAIRMIGVE